MRLSWWTVPTVRYPKGMMMAEKFRHCGYLIGKSLRSESLLEVCYLPGCTHSVYTWQQPRKNGLTRRPSETISYCISYLSCGCHKMPDRTNWRKKGRKGLFWLMIWGLRVQSIMTRKSGQRELEVAGLEISAVKERLIQFSSFYSVQDHNLENDAM